MAEPTPADIRTAIEAFLGAGAVSAAVTDAPDLFEIYLWKLTTEAAIAEGATATVETATGPAPTPYAFRRGPGPIARAGGQPFVHARLAFPGRDDLEVHQGIYVSGTSLNRHECDVVVLDRAECVTARGRNVDPRSSKSVLAIEAKFYGGRIGIALARGFAGLEKDLYLKKRRTFFVTNSKMELVSRYLNRHSFEWQEEVALPPGRVDDLSASLRRAFQVYRTS